MAIRPDTTRPTATLQMYMPNADIESSNDAYSDQPAIVKLELIFCVGVTPLIVFTFDNAEKRLKMPRVPLLELNRLRCNTSTGGQRYRVSFLVAHTPLRLQAWQLYPSSSSSVSVSVKASRHSCEHRHCLNEQELLFLPIRQCLNEQELLLPISTADKSC